MWKIFLFEIEEPPFAQGYWVAGAPGEEPKRGRDRTKPLEGLGVLETEASRHGTPRLEVRRDDLRLERFAGVEIVDPFGEPPVGENLPIIGELEHQRVIFGSRPRLKLEASQAGEGLLEGLVVRATHVDPAPAERDRTDPDASAVFSIGGIVRKHMGGFVDHVSGAAERARAGVAAEEEKERDEEEKSSQEELRRSHARQIGTPAQPILK